MNVEKASQWLTFPSLVPKNGAKVRDSGLDFAEKTARIDIRGREPFKFWESAEMIPGLRE